MQFDLLKLCNFICIQSKSMLKGLKDEKLVKLNSNNIDEMLMFVLLDYVTINEISLISSW